MSRVSSRLVTLLPAILLFNRTSAQVGFRQTTPGDNGRTIWVEPGRSGTLWWQSADNQRLQVASKGLDDAGTQTSWSAPFEVTETTIGSYPVVLLHGQYDRQLFCVNLDQEGKTFSVAVQSSESCHILINQHTELVLQGSLEGAGIDPRYFSSAPYGEAVPVAAKDPFCNKRNLHLVLESASNPAERVAVIVDLNRAGTYRVPLGTGPPAPTVNLRDRAPSRRQAAKSTLSVPAHVTVELRNRVARVSIMPAMKADDDTNSYRSTANLDIGRLRIAVLTENTSGFGMDMARREAFTVSLAGVKAEMQNLPNRRRFIDFKITDALAVLQQQQDQEQDVVVVNTTRPFLHAWSQRDDVSMLDVHLRSVKLNFGELEVSVTDALISQARLLAHNLAPAAAGLTLPEIQMRATTPYNSLRLEPPPASSKYVLSNLEVGVLTLSAWCRIHLPDAHYIPRTLRDTIQMVNFFNNRLDVKGAQVKLPQQTLFTPNAPAEGGPSAVLSRVWDNYLPHVKASWRSLLQHSNIVLGGALSSNFWAPRKRIEHAQHPPVCRIGPSGELTVLPQSASVASEQERRGSTASGARGSTSSFSSLTDSLWSMTGSASRRGSGDLRRPGPGWSM